MLDEIPAYPIVLVEPIDSREQIALACRQWDLDVEGLDPDLRTRVVLLTHVPRGRGILTNEDGSQPNACTVPPQGIDPLANLFEHRFGDRSAFEELCGHPRSLGRVPDRTGDAGPTSGPDVDDQRHAGTVGQVEVRRRVHYDEIRSRAGNQPPDVGSAQRGRTTDGC